jgi:hypothetical protein
VCRPEALPLSERGTAECGVGGSGGRPPGAGRSTRTVVESDAATMLSFALTQAAANAPRL